MDDHVLRPAVDDAGWIQQPVLCTATRCTAQVPRPAQPLHELLSGGVLVDDDCRGWDLDRHWDRPELVCAMMAHLGLGLGMLLQLHHLSSGQLLLGRGSSLVLAS